MVGYAELEASDGNTFAVNVKPGPYHAHHRFVNANTGQATELITIPVTGVALALEQGGAAERAAERKKAA